MMRRTDRHFRYMLRLLTRRTLLYTEMRYTREVLASPGIEERCLKYLPEEKPLVLQLGGDDPAQMAECAKIAEDLGYDEVNINVGCPSERVQSGNFGVCLMGQPDVVARMVEAMRAAVDIPVTVKHRIGFDHQDSYEEMLGFVRTVRAAGCERFTVHARKAWLKGLSPKENRNVPPLRYEVVYRLKEELPALFIEINGGIKTLEEAKAHLQFVDAVMIGRAAYDDPYLFAQADELIYGEAGERLSRVGLVEAMLPYIEAELQGGERLALIAGHLLNLFAGRPGARRWRHHLTQHMHRPGAGPEVVERALGLVDPARQAAAEEA